MLRDMFPTLEPALIGNGRFTASGWRNDAENYLFLNRADAEDFKEAMELPLPADIVGFAGDFHFAFVVVTAFCFGGLATSTVKSCA